MTTTITTIESIMASLIIIGGRALIHNDDGCEGRESRGEERERERERLLRGWKFLGPLITCVVATSISTPMTIRRFVVVLT